jgi:glycerol-3-phosphate acyltransferase PlsY
MTYLLSATAILAAYLIGSIPFGYWLALWLKGVDVRTHGSGNIGATNVARVIGFWWFWPVFLFDMAKGFLPTWGFPRVVETLTNLHPPGDLPVLLALASILGHNYPVYLKFKGGKGVATSLGAVFALDALASLAAAAGFAAFLMITRYVSLSSLLGGWVFLIVHFQHVASPWSPQQRAMTILTVGLNVLLLVRHRKNMARIWQGTEPKISLRKKREKPSGRINSSWLFTLAAVVAFVVFAGALWRKLVARDVLEVGRYSFIEVARVGTGHQRAERVAFADSGNVLAVTCPRYERLVLYRVTERNDLELIRDLALDGKPVAVCSSDKWIYALLRPSGDRRHVEPGWWETFDFQGERVGERVTVGFYPDDLALPSDGQHALVLTSGRAEGGTERGEPALTVYELGTKPQQVGRVTFDGSVDNPVRLTLSESGRCAVVALAGSKLAASIDLGDPANPQLIGRSPMPETGCPYPSHAGDDAILMPVASETEAVALPLSGFGECVAMTLPKGSGIGLLQINGAISLGRLTLRTGAMNLGSTRPTGIAYSRDRGLFAVANRSGGVHLVAVRVGDEGVAAR